MERESGVLLIGGGLDSLTLLSYLVSNQHMGTVGRVDLLHVDYGQKACWQELSAAAYFADKYKMKLHTASCSMANLGYASILKGTEVGKDQTDKRLEGRNVTLIGMAATLTRTLDGNTIWVGFHREPESRPFPDATIYTLEAMNIVLARAYTKTLKVRAPFWSRSRLSVFLMGRELDKEIETRAWTCYEGNQAECGTCTHCLQKKQLQEEAGLCVG